MDKLPPDGQQQLTRRGARTGGESGQAAYSDRRCRTCCARRWIQGAWRERPAKSPPGIIMITKRAANPQFTKNPSPSTMATTTTTVTIIVNSARRGLVSLAQEVLAAGFAVELAAAFVAVVPSAVTVVGLAAALVAGPVGASDTLSAALPVAAGRCSFA